MKTTLGTRHGGTLYKVGVQWTKKRRRVHLPMDFSTTGYSTTLFYDDRYDSTTYYSTTGTIRRRWIYDDRLFDDGPYSTTDVLTKGHTSRPTFWRQGIYDDIITMLITTFCVKLSPSNWSKIDRGGFCQKHKIRCDLFLSSK